MKKFPDDFNMEQTHNLIMENFLESNKDIINRCREYVHDQSVKYLSKGLKYFFIDLSMYTKDVRKLVIDELMTRFSVILSVYRTKDIIISSKYKKWALQKLSNKNELIYPNFNYYLESAERWCCAKDEYYKNTPTYNIGTIYPFFISTTKFKYPHTEYNYPSSYIILLSPDYIGDLDVEILSDSINNSSSLTNTFWIFD